MTAKPHLPPSPIDAGKVTVTAIESVQPLDLFPDLLLVRVHTDAGLIGHGETYYCAEGRAGHAARLDGASAVGRGRAGH